MPKLKRTLVPHKWIIGRVLISIRMCTCNRKGESMLGYRAIGSIRLGGCRHIYSSHRMTMDHKYMAQWINMDVTRVDVHTHEAFRPHFSVNSKCILFSIKLYVCNNNNVHRKYATCSCCIHDKQCALYGTEIERHTHMRPMTSAMKRDEKAKKKNESDQI